MSSSEIAELETRLAFSDETIAQLDAALVAQQLRIDRLEARLEALVLEVRQSGQEDVDDDGYQPPPHY